MQQVTKKAIVHPANIPVKCFFVFDLPALVVFYIGAAVVLC